MSLTLNVTDHWSDGKRIHVVGTLIPAGNYVAGGDNIPFNNPVIKSASAPVYVEVHGYTVYDYAVILGTDLNTNKLKVTVTNTGVELAGAWPAVTIASPPAFHAIFKQFI